MTDTYKCLHCGKDFYPIRKNARFCCNLCYSRHRAGIVFGEKRACFICGTEFTVDGTKMRCPDCARRKIHPSYVSTTRERICTRCGASFVTNFNGKVTCPDCIPEPPIFMDEPEIRQRIKNFKSVYTIISGDCKGVRLGQFELSMNLQVLDEGTRFMRQNVTYVLRNKKLVPEGK